MLFLASGKEKVLKSESYTDKIFPHLARQKILQHIQNLQRMFLDSQKRCKRIILLAAKRRNIKFTDLVPGNCHFDCSWICSVYLF